ncbi:UDP-glucosyltransferase 2-like [Cydia amplana]|uniref:UDP-glucosyltransferase 2-like n=1 Tax=Cydia amplana TaxID=1869771 RepID=UPI002FE60178
MELIHLTTLVIILSSLAEICVSYEILVIFPEPTKSHGILGDGYVRNLLDANHKVTYITPFPWKELPSNLTQIDISSNLETSDEYFQNLTIEYPNNYEFLQMLSYTMGRLVVTHPAVQAFLRKPDVRFDVVVAEWIDSEMYSSFAGYFSAPLIWSVSTQLHWQPLRLMDEVPNPSYSADVNSGYLPPLNFVQRLKELNVQIRKLWILRHKIHPLELEIYDTIFKSAAMTTGRDLLPYTDIPNNYSMMLVNTHPSVATPWRVPPSVKEIAGYHIKLPVEVLDANLQSIMDASPQGVIYFSFGTTNSGKDMEDGIRKEFLELFRSLNQTVLWKLDVPLENLPNNVHLMQWAPQTSILNHPNTKVFITHGGLLSLIEAIHFGVPMVTIPHVGDQYNNAAVAVKKGIAIKLENGPGLPSELRDALKMMLTDWKYRDNMKRVSRTYHHRPVSPGKELVHWVEHVVITRGATYLRSPALLVPSYQKAYLDLAALILFVITVIFLILYFSIRWCLRRIRQKCNCKQ